MRKTVHINTLLLTDEELNNMSFKNEDGIYCSIRQVTNGNEVKIYAIMKIE